MRRPHKRWTNKNIYDPDILICKVLCHNLIRASTKSPYRLLIKAIARSKARGESVKGGRSALHFCGEAQAARRISRPQATKRAICPFCKICVKGRSAAKGFSANLKGLFKVCSKNL